MKPRRNGTLACALLLLSFALRALAAAAPWADAPSDLPQDPALTLGALPNGLRYALFPNAEPANRVSLRLLVSAGSLHENDNERGLAHFVEHMAFRGTRNRPRGELIAGLERMGISFGADSIAFTSFDNTIYHLDLPDASEATIREGLRVFHEYAANIEFAPADIERERGIILSEMATRDTAGARVGARYLAFAWPAARENTRSPIGVEKQIRRFTQKQFRAFYDAWYRPGRIAIIAVGQIDKERLRALITDEFSTLAARAPARPEPPPLAALPPAKKLPPLEVCTDIATSGFSIALTHAYPETPAGHTRETRKRDLEEALVCDMLQRRLLFLARKPGALTGDPDISSTRHIPGLRLTQYSSSGNLDNWDAIIAYSEQALRRAREYGFTQDELDAAKASCSNNWRQAIRGATTRHNAALCQELASHLLKGTGFVSPETAWDDCKPMLESITPDDCRAAFRRMWGDAPPRIFIAAHKEFSKIKSSQIEKVLAASRAAPVSEPPGTAQVELAYTDFGPPGRVASQKTLDEHGIRLVTFANNTLLNFKHTDYDKDYVFINVRAGFGRLMLPKNMPGLGQFASCAFLAGGLGKHPVEYLSQILERHMINLDFRVEDDALNFSVFCPASETPAALRLLTAYITDPAYQPNAKTLAAPAIATYYSTLRSSPSSCINACLERIITADRRFGSPDYAEPESRNMIELRFWMHQQLNSTTAEVSIAGDITFEDACESVRATLGSIPPKPTRETAAQKRPLNTDLAQPDPAVTFLKATQPFTIEVPRDLRQGAFIYVWPVPEKRDIHDERASHLLASVLANAARACLREELGAAYAVNADFVQHAGFDTFNYLMLHAEVDKGKLDKAIAAIRENIARLAREGISEDEFLRAKKPFLENYDRAMRTNAYWCHTALSDAQTNPERLAAIQSRATDMAGVTREEINAQAAQYLRPGGAYLFKTTPAKK